MLFCANELGAYMALLPLLSNLWKELVWHGYQSSVEKYTKFCRETQMGYAIRAFNLRKVLTDVPVIAVMLRRLMPFLSRPISRMYCCL